MAAEDSVWPEVLKPLASHTPTAQAAPSGLGAFIVTACLLMGGPPHCQGLSWPAVPAARLKALPVHIPPGPEGKAVPSGDCTSQDTARFCDPDEGPPGSFTSEKQTDPWGPPGPKIPGLVPGRCGHRKGGAGRTGTFVCPLKELLALPGRALAPGAADTESTLPGSGAQAWGTTAAQCLFRSCWRPLPRHRYSWGDSSNTLRREIVSATPWRGPRFPWDPQGPWWGGREHRTLQDETASDWPVSLGSRWHGWYGSRLGEAGGSFARFPRPHHTLPGGPAGSVPHLTSSSLGPEVRTARPQEALSGGRGVSTTGPSEEALAAVRWVPDLDPGDPSPRTNEGPRGFKENSGQDRRRCRGKSELSDEVSCPDDGGPTARRRTCCHEARSPDLHKHLSSH
ncbi:uncharacterized protein LOC125937371 [Panthera uncia]|uniref:uncharacterized protein LOC125937371 n=1 Tax=Panthera uncia TaxID=29064 RepID=UPI0020FF8F5D|nr:uncharacterized protein LOC125937371 [Panthera uncia]